LTKPKDTDAEIIVGGNLNRLDTLLSQQWFNNQPIIQQWLLNYSDQFMTIFVYEDANGKKLC
jgi:hypothetical protein